MATKINVQLWQTRAQRMLDLKQSQRKQNLEIIKMYKGEFMGEPVRAISPDEMSELNFVFEYVKVKVGATYARNPHIFVRARNSRFAPFAETMESVINYYWRELKLKQKIKRAIIDGVLTPPGWVGIGFTGMLERELEADIVSSDIKTEGQSGILDETIKNDDIFTKYISSWNMAWPDGYNNIREAPYLMEIQDLPLIDVLNNPMYKDSKYKLKDAANRPRVRKITSFTMKADVPVGNDIDTEDDTTKVKLFHIWDKRGNQRFTLAQGFNDDTLFEREWNYLIEGFPKYDLVFNPIPQTDEDANSIPLSDIVPMLPQLRDLSIINTAILRHGKRHGSVILVRKGGLTDGEIANLESAGDLEIIELESLSDDRIKTFNTPALPADWYKIRELIIEDLMRISGFQQLLAQQKGIETATESENLRAGQLIRQSESVDVVEDFTVDIARGLAGLAWQFKTRQQISEIIGEPVDARMWPDLPEDQELAKRIIQKEIHFRIDAGSTRPPKDEAVERKQFTDLAFGLKERFPNRIKDDVLLRQVLKKFDFKDIDEAIIGYDDQERAVAQAENQLLAQGMAQLVSPNELHVIHIEVHGQAPQKTPELDQHILLHARFMEAQQPRVAGGTQPMKTAPELRRGGVPQNVDLAGGATNTLRRTGANV